VTHPLAVAFRLHKTERLRGRALLNVAIDSKLRGWDLVTLRVREVVPGEGLKKS
jgi:hypothetical protein